VHPVHIHSELSCHHEFPSGHCQLVVEKISCKSHPQDLEFSKMFLTINSITLFFEEQKQPSLGKLK